MKTALIITVGSRDLQLPRESFIQLFGEADYTLLLDKRQNPYARKMADYLLSEPNRFDKAKAYLLFPIIKPCLDKLKSEGKLPERILFIVTDQPVTVGDFHFGDTISAAQVLSRLLTATYRLPDKVFKTFSVKENVNFLDNMYALFESRASMAPFSELKDFDRVLLLNQGGIDAINFGLLFTTIKIFGRKLVQLCVDERTETCFEIGFVQQSLKQSEHEKARAFCLRYTYSAIEALDLEPPIKQIAQYASSRLHFDFDAARKYLDELRDVRFRSFLTEQTAQLVQVSQNESSLLRELYINAKIHYGQAAYVDFLLRFFRIIEEIARTTAVGHIGLAEFNHKEWADELKKRLSLAEFAALKAYLQSVKVGKDELTYLSPTTATFQAINHFYQNPIADFIDTMLPLSQLRNKSIGAHDFEPVSKDLIDTKLAAKQTTIEQVFEKLDAYLQITENPFDRINNQIISLLNK